MRLMLQRIGEAREGRRGNKYNELDHHQNEDSWKKSRKTYDARAATKVDMLLGQSSELHRFRPSKWMDSGDALHLARLAPY